MITRQSAWIAAIAAVLLLAGAPAAVAQTVGSPSEVFGTSDQRDGDSGSSGGGGGEGGSEGGQQPSPQDVAPRADWDSANYGSGNPRRAATPPDMLPPFGANLFEGGFRGTMADGLNPGYRIKPGDQVTLRVWGAVEMDQVMPVDAQGNIFIPRIGPLQVQGLNSSQLNSRVRGAITEVYPDQRLHQPPGRAARGRVRHRLRREAGALRRHPE